MNPIMFNLLLVLVSTRWTESNHKVKVKRDTTKIEEVIQNLNSLTYSGQIELTAQEGGWFPTTTGEMMQYNTPRRSEPVELSEAVTICTEMDSKLWDENPQLALGFSNIEPNANYWIIDDNGAMAQYTKAEPEVIYDNICTQVKITTPTENDQQKIEVTTVLDTSNSSLGCSTEEFTGLTLCLRPVNQYKYANNKNYRNLQEEAKAMINQDNKDAAVKRLGDINSELTTNHYKTNPEQRKILPKLETITKNVDNIKKEDEQPFPNFEQIKTNWTDIIEKMQDLEIISTKIASDHKLKELEEQMVNTAKVNVGHQAANNIAWTTKWNIINQNIENIKTKIHNLETHTTRVPAEEVKGTEQQEGEDREDADTEPEPAKGYFQKFLQNYERSQQSLQRFCLNWKIDCRVVMMGGMIMTGIGAGCTILIIFITIQMCNTAKKVKRIRDYLDIKDTRREQDKDDQYWRELIDLEEMTNKQPKTTFIPNPIRNRALIKVINDKLKGVINREDQNDQAEAVNCQKIRQWIPAEIKSVIDQQENETIPLLERSSMP